MPTLLPVLEKTRFTDEFCRWVATTLHISVELAKHWGQKKQPLVIGQHANGIELATSLGVPVYTTDEFLVNPGDSKRVWRSHDTFKIVDPPDGVELFFDSLRVPSDREILTTLIDTFMCVNNTTNHPLALNIIRGWWPKKLRQLVAEHDGIQYSYNSLSMCTIQT